MLNYGSLSVTVLILMRHTYSMLSYVIDLLQLLLINFHFILHCYCDTGPSYYFAFRYN